MKIKNKNIRILKTDVAVLQTPEIEMLFSSEKKVIFKLNTLYLIRALRDEEFCRLLNSSTVSLIDGRGVQWSAKFLTLPVSSNKLVRTLQSLWQMLYSGLSIIFYPKFVKDPISEVFPGTVALKIMLKKAEEKGLPVFFFGSSDQTLTKATENLRREFPKLIISGGLNGYDYQQDSTIDPAKIINETDAQLLIVSLGSPKQELWIKDNIDNLSKIMLAVGEGGTLDRIANPSQCSPKWVNTIGMEWLWRLFFNKSLTDNTNRLQRFWDSVPVFIYEVVKWKIKYGQTKV